MRHEGADLGEHHRDRRVAGRRGIIGSDDPSLARHAERRRLVEDQRRTARTTTQRDLDECRHPAQLEVVLRGTRATDEPTVVDPETEIEDHAAVEVEGNAAAGVPRHAAQLKRGASPDEQPAEVDVEGGDADAGVECRLRPQIGGELGRQASVEPIGDRASDAELEFVGRQGSEHGADFEAGADQLGGCRHRPASGVERRDRSLDDAADTASGIGFEVGDVGDASGRTGARSRPRRRRASPPRPVAKVSTDTGPQGTPTVATRLIAATSLAARKAAVPAAP